MNNKERNRLLGIAIRERRRLLNLTQSDLAQSSGINRSHLSLIETGEHHPTARTLGEIARALNTTPEELEMNGAYFAQAAELSTRKTYPGLLELLNDPDALTLYKITEDEVHILKSIRLHWNNPSKNFFLQALLDYRKSREKE